MIMDRLYTQGSILGAAAQASAIRNDVITNNIANVDTPKFKRSVVDFEKTLASALKTAGSPAELDITKVKPSTRVISEELHYRLDGNNVDIDNEMVNLYQNSIRYETLINSMMSNSKLLNLVITGR